jgi:sulfonate transport system permease protein
VSDTDGRVVAPPPLVRDEAASPTAPPTLRREPGPAERNRRAHRARQRRRETALAWSVPILLVGAWQWAAATETISPLFFPAPTDLVATGSDMVASGELQHHLAASATRIALGLLVGTGSGVALGFAMGMSRLLRAALDSTLSALYVVPKLALLPLLLLIFGVGDTPMILLVAISVFFLVWITTMHAVTSVPDGWREAATSFGAGGLQLVRHVLLPASLPQILTGLRLATGMAILTTIAIEFVQGSDGLGRLIWLSWTLFLPKRMYVGIVVVALLGVAANLLVRLTARLLAPWDRFQVTP